MKQWTKIGIAVGAIVLAIAAGTGAYAMRGDDGGGDNATRDSQNDQSDEKRIADPNQEDGGAGGGLAAICLEGTVDCQDTDLGDPMDQPCPDGGCTAENYDCPPDQSCTDTRLADGEACPEGLDPQACFPVGQPYEVCVTMESDPPQTKCYAAGCGSPVETLPAEVVTVEAIDPLVDPAENIRAEKAAKIREQEAAAGDEVVPCTPADDCSSPSPELVRCLPPDCAISSDGAVRVRDNGIRPAADQVLRRWLWIACRDVTGEDSIEPQIQVDPPVAE